MYDGIEAQLLISEGKEDGTNSWVECEELMTKLRKEIYKVQVTFSVLIRTLYTAKYRYFSMKGKVIDRSGWLEAIHWYLASRLCLPDCEVEGQQPRSNKVSTYTCRGRRPITEESSRVCRLKVTGFILVRTYTTSVSFVSRVEKVANKEGRLEVAWRHLA